MALGWYSALEPQGDVQRSCHWVYLQPFKELGKVPFDG